MKRKPVKPQYRGDPKLKPLTIKQRMFVTEFLKDNNVAAAAVRAGYNYGSGDDTFNRPQIRYAIEQAIKKIEKNTGVTAEKVVEALWHIANSDIGEIIDEHGRVKSFQELTPEQRKTISSIDVNELFEGAGRDRTQVGLTKRIALWNKVHALELLAKKFKLLTDNIHVSGSIDLAKAIQQARTRKKNAD